MKMNIGYPNGLEWNKTLARIASRGPDGRLVSALLGNETDEELRVLTLRFTQHYWPDQSSDFNPFRILGGLSRESLCQMITGMNREAMLFLFESEWEFAGLCLVIFLWLRWGRGV
jgi:hypothetical protein